MVPCCAQCWRQHHVRAQSFILPGVVSGHEPLLLPLLASASAAASPAASAASDRLHAPTARSPQQLDSADIHHALSSVARSQKNLSRHVLRLEEYEHGEKAPPNSWVLLARKQSDEDAPWSTISPRHSMAVDDEDVYEDEDEDEDEDVVDCMDDDEADAEQLRVQIDAVD